MCSFIYKTDVEFSMQLCSYVGKSEQKKKTQETQRTNNHVPAPLLANDKPPAPWSKLATSGAEKIAGPPELLANEEYLKSESKPKEPAAPKEPPASGNELPPNGDEKRTGPPDFMDGPAMTEGTTGKVGAASTGDAAPRNGPIKPGISLFDGAITAPDAINRTHIFL